MSEYNVEVRRGDVLVLTWGGPLGTEDMARAALNVDDDSEVEIFPASKIEPIGLLSYLAEGHGIATSDLKGNSSALDALKGIIIVLSARAFSTGTGTIKVREPMALVDRFREAESELGAPLPIETESAKGIAGNTPANPPKSDARIGGMVAMAVLLFLVLFVTFFVWSAG